MKKYIINYIDKKNPLILRDLARVKWEAKLSYKYYKRKIYKIISFYNFRKATLCYPRSIQFPLTNRCNLDCIMCNIQSKTFKDEIQIEVLEKVLKQNLFKRVNSVGINGGEPFLVNNLINYVDIFLCSLPKLKSIYIISNGVFTRRIQEMLPMIRQHCIKSKVQLILSISIDGCEEVHDTVRNKKGTFAHALETIQMIQRNKTAFCDYFNIICTITKNNIFEINELDVLAKKNNWTISYNVATVHERLNNNSKEKDFSIFSDREATYLAIEFFYKKFLETKSEIYYTLYRYLEDNEHKRICNCSYLKSGITITPEGDICFCATHSKVIGSIYDNKSLYDIYFKAENYNNEIRQKYCTNCSHYMMGDILDKEYKNYIKECIDQYRSYRF